MQKKIRSNFLSLPISNRGIPSKNAFFSDAAVEIAQICTAVQRVNPKWRATANLQFQSGAARRVCNVAKAQFLCKVG